MHAELFQPVTTSVPTIRTLSVDGKQGFASCGHRSLGARCSEASDDTDLFQPTGQDLLLLLLLPCKAAWSGHCMRVDQNRGGGLH
jgi:hypothetical protein